VSVWRGGQDHKPAHREAVTIVTAALGIGKGYASPMIYSLHRTADRPSRFPSPFDRSAVHPLARRALNHCSRSTLGVAPAGPEQQCSGVLVVVARCDRLPAWLSGMGDGQWDIDGWVPRL
jgi:hypothetical protein